MAFVVVGWQVVNAEKKADGTTKREQPITSRRFETRSGAEAWRDLARKSGYPNAEVRDVMKHDDIN